VDLQGASQVIGALSQNAAAINDQIDQLAAMSGQIALISQQLRGLEPAYNSTLDLGALSDQLSVMSDNAAAVNAQIDQLVAMSGQLDQISQQLRGIETVYNSTLDLGALSQQLSALSQGATTVNDQVDLLASLSSQQLDLTSQQLRGIETVYNSTLDLDALSQQLSALSQSASTVNDQVDLLASLSSQQLDLTSDQLRGLETIYDDSTLDLDALSQDLFVMSLYAAAVNDQIDQLSALSSQQLDLTSGQLRGLGTVYDSTMNLGILSQQLLTMSLYAAAVNDQIDQLSALSSQQLDLTSEQLRSLETVYNSTVDLDALSQQLTALSQSAAAVNPQIDQLATLSDQQLEQVSQQLRSLEAIYNANLDLEATSQLLADLSQNVAAVNSQVDQVAAVTEQLEQVSQQLRALEVYSDIGLGGMSDSILALTGYTDVAQRQVAPITAYASQAADQVGLWSSVLRTLEPYADVDYGAIRGQILDLSGNLPMARDQIDQLVAMSGQLGQLSGALRSLESYADTDFTVIGQDIANLSTNVSAVNAQLDQGTAMVDQLIAGVDNATASITQIQATLDSRLRLVTIVIIIFMIWILLTMLAPLYLGWVLVSGRLHFITVES
jgi:predicted translin family RNA/ssDNA-binding protein